MCYRQILRPILHQCPESLRRSLALLAGLDGSALQRVYNEWLRLSALSR